MVSHFCEECDLDVVISSAWREYDPMPEITLALWATGFNSRSRFIGGTPQIENPHRGTEIELWLTQNPRRRHIILDDSRFMLESLNFVWVDPDFGLRASDIEKAKTLLKQCDSSSS